MIQALPDAPDAPNGFEVTPSGVYLPDGRFVSRDEYEIAKFVRAQGGLRGTQFGEKVDIVDYLEGRFFIIETPGKPIKLFDPQPAILRFIFHNKAGVQFRQVLYSTVKKEGKTTITSGVVRYVTETKGPFAEAYCIANSLEQATGRIFNGVEKSIRLAPGFDTSNRVLSLANGLPEWAIIERQITHVPTGGVIKSIGNSSRGQAGSNPVITAWSETWGLKDEDDLRMWAELTPVPTREFSMRWVETYAGYQNDPGALWDYYMLGTNSEMGAVRLDCHSFPDWPQQYMWECSCGSCCGHNGPGLPLWVNEMAQMFTYWDVDERARRAPWKQGTRGARYYSAARVEFASDPQQYDRLHLNHWITSQDQFLPIEWWDACYDSSLPPLDTQTPIVIGVDAAVSNDCTAVVGVSRRPGRPSDPAIRLVRILIPPQGGQFDYDSSDGLQETLDSWISRYNVVQVCYDPYQMHHLATQLNNRGDVWVNPFSQGADRMAADKQLFDVIRDRRLAHFEPVSDSRTALRQHVLNADKKRQINEDSRYRIVKRHESLKIDGVVATSMATYEALRLDLD